MEALLIYTFFFTGVITILNCLANKWSTRFIMGLTVTKMVAIAILIVTGIVRLAQGYVEQQQYYYKSGLIIGFVNIDNHNADSNQRNNNNEKFNNKNDKFNDKKS